MLSKIASAQPEPIFITSFTHKGGVGKTTGLHNIACVLAKEFKLRVLLIDCDPQCSLTSVILHDFFVKIGKNYNKKNRANLTESQLKQLGEEIFYEKIKVEAEAPRPDALKTRSHNREVNENLNIKRRTVYECFKHEDLAYFAEEEIIKKTVRDEVELVHLSQYGGLYVLPGDLLLNSLERDVSGGFSFGKIEGLERQKRIPGAIPQMFREIARQNNIDLILVDLSPAATFFNQSIVMSSDYFIISNLADYYSRRSITSIADVLKAWNRDVGFLRELKSSSAYFRFPACPKFLGHIFHRVKVHEGQATLDKQDKIDLIQQEIRRRFIDENLLGTDKDTIVVDKFKLLEPPIIKEFDRFYDQAVEKGIPMPYITGDNIKWEDGKQSPAGKKAVGNTQQFFMNSYFTAVSIIFSNLSDEHHLRLRNIFKPTQSDAQEPEEIRQDQYEFVGNYGGERLCFSMRRVDDAYRVFVPELRHMFGILRDLIKDKRKDIVNLFFEEILNGFLPDGKWNNDVRDNKFNSLAQKFNNESEAKEESKQNVLVEMNEENPILETLNELQLLAQIHLDRRQIVQNYIGNCLEEKKTMATLTKYIQSEEAKEAYVRHAIDGRVRLGAKAFSLCALAKEKNLRIWEPTYFPQIKLKEVQLAGEGTDDFIDLIEIERNVFRKLIRKNSVIKDPFEANGLIGKRQNPHEYDGPELDKKVKKR